MADGKVDPSSFSMYTYMQGMFETFSNWHKRELASIVLFMLTLGLGQLSSNPWLSYSAFKSKHQSKKSFILLSPFNIILD